MITTEPLQAKSPPQWRPEFFRLPRTGERDAFFGLSRSWYYAAERQGLKLVRVRTRGKARGTVLISYDAVADLIRQSAGNGGNA
jgi:hypothetical protein